jgi:hypothetical protein
VLRNWQRLTAVLEHERSSRIRQINLELYSARVAAEKARTVYISAIKRMRAAEINMAHAVHEKRAAQ